MKKLKSLRIIGIVLLVIYTINTYSQVIGNIKLLPTQPIINQEFKIILYTYHTSEPLVHRLLDTFTVGTSTFYPINFCSSIFLTAPIITDTFIYKITNTDLHKFIFQLVNDTASPCFNSANTFVKTSDSISIQLAPLMNSQIISENNNFQIIQNYQSSSKPKITFEKILLENKKLSLLNIQGQVIFEMQLMAGLNQFEITTSIPNGIYICKIDNSVFKINLN